MTSLRFQISISLDGYAAGPNQSLEHPLGVGGHQLHQWAFGARTFRQTHGMDGGETGPDDDVAAESIRNIGATIMGRHMFGGHPGGWDAETPWQGWWGKAPPFHTPVFVLTRHPRPSLEMEGGTTFHFVTNGIHAALDRATAAARGKDVSLGGGASVVQQFLRAGLIDEMELHVAPVMLGGGERLFEHTDGRQTAYECVRIIHTPAATHYKFRRR